MKLGVFSLSLFNPESSHPTEAHTHFPYNIKCTLSALPPPPFPPNFAKLLFYRCIPPCYFGCSKRN